MYFNNQMGTYPVINNIVNPVGFNDMNYNLGLTSPNYSYHEDDTLLTEEEYEEKILQSLQKQEKVLKKRQIVEQKAWEIDQMKFSREQREMQLDNLKIQNHYNSCDYLESLGIHVGRLGFSDKYVVKIKNDKPIISSKDGIGKIISESIQKKVSIKDDIDEISKVSNSEINLISYLISKVKVSFRPDIGSTAFTNEEGELCFNSFVPSNLMLKKYGQFSVETYISAIEIFLLNLNKNEDDFILNLIGSHYQRTIKRPVAVALKGDKETIEMFFSILEEIFGSSYMSLINEKTLRENSFNELIEEKLITYVKDIPEDIANSDGFQDFIKKAIVDKSIKNSENGKVHLFGLTFIVSDSLDSIIKNCHSKISIIEVNNLDFILSKMDIQDKVSLHDFIQNDYENLTNILAQNDFDEKKAHEIIKAKINTLEENIEEFIIDITLNPKVLMSKLKDEDLELFEKFESGYKKHNGVKQSIILEYFHAVYGQTNFPKNADFLEFLKENPNFFKDKAESKSDGKYYIYPTKN